MMKKLWCTAISVMLVASLFGSTAMADSSSSDEGSKDSWKEKKSSWHKGYDRSKHGDDEETNTVTSDTYGNATGNSHSRKDYSGLWHAFDNVKDKPADERIAELLATKYGLKEMTELLKQQADDLTEGVQTDETKAVITLTPEEIAAKKEEMKAYAKALHEQMKQHRKSLRNGEITFSQLADIYAASGSVTEAVYAQKEAIHMNLTNLDSYKQLGKFYEKLGKKGVKAYVNGEEPEFDVPPLIKDGSTLVPFRAISESLKAEVTWNAEEKSVTVKKDGIEVKLILGSTTAYVNGKEVKLEVPGQLLEGRTFVPVRFISEALKAQVDWEPVSQSVVITDGTAANSAATGSTTADSSTAAAVTPAAN
jgi:tetratricopeptide (TPR) repeat protein